MHAYIHTCIHKHMHNMHKLFIPKHNSKIWYWDTLTKQTHTYTQRLYQL